MTRTLSLLFAAAAAFVLVACSHLDADSPAQTEAKPAASPAAQQERPVADVPSLTAFRSV